MLSDAGTPPDWGTLLLCLADAAGPVSRRGVADALSWDDARLETAVAEALAEEPGSVEASADNVALTVVGRLRANELAAKLGSAPSSSNPALVVPDR